MEKETDRETQKKRISRKSLILIIFVVVAVLAAAGAVIWYIGKVPKQPAESSHEGDAGWSAMETEQLMKDVGTAPDEDDMSWFTDAGKTTGEADMQEDPSIAEEEDKTEETKETAAVSMEPVRVQDITVYPDETAIFQCYEPEASQYQWEFYSTLDRKWEDVSQKYHFTVETQTDSLGRQVSALLVPGTEENERLSVRCSALLPEGETAVSEGCLYLFDGRIEKITAVPVEAEAGEYLSGRMLHVTVQNEQGEETELTGLQGLVFCVKQNEEESTIYDEEKSLTTETYTYTKVSKEVPYYFVEEGEQTVPVRLHIKEQIYDTQAVITGRDTCAPVFEEIRADYEISDHDVAGTKVKLYASVTDNYSSPSELSFAFGEDGDAGNISEWTDTFPVETEIKKNGIYYLFARDKNGNISCEELEIIIVDMKPPEIINLVYHENARGDGGWIEVTATDKTAMEYCFHPKGSSGGSWQEEPEYFVASGGDYVAEVRDAAGNLAKGDIQVPFADVQPPIITGIDVIGE